MYWPDMMFPPINLYSLPYLIYKEKLMLDFTINFRGHDIEISILSYHKGYPAKLWGPFEGCYPEEGPEVEFEVDSGCDLLDEILEENHYDELTSLVLEEIDNADY